MAFATISVIGAVPCITTGITIIGLDSWVGLSILTKAYLIETHCGHPWHGFKIGLRVSLGLFLSLGYMVDGLENILHCPP